MRPDHFKGLTRVQGLHVLEPHHIQYDAELMFLLTQTRHWTICSSALDSVITSSDFTQIHGPALLQWLHTLALNDYTLCVWAAWLLTWTASLSISVH